MNVAEYIGRELAGLGAKCAFGLVGSGNFAVTNALIRSGVRFVAARHECAAVAMADGYARVSGETGIATVHQGPGLTNAMTALAEAAKSRTPLLLLAADTSRGAVRSNFRVDQAGLASSVGAVGDHVYTPSSVPADLARAWDMATRQRRTVVLNLPLDVQAAEAPGRPLPVTPDLRPAAPDAEALGEVARMVAAATRPVIVGGRGAVVSGAGPALERLGEVTGALLATSANGNGLFAGNPWHIGISGGFSSPVAAELMRSADLLLSFGASLNMWTTRHGGLIGAHTKVVQVDVEASAIGAHRPVDAGLVGDAALTARRLARELEAAGAGSQGFRTAQVARRIAGGGWRNVAHTDASTADCIDPRTLCVLLEEILPPDRAVAVDSGHFMGWPAMYLSIADPSGFVFAQSYQSVGLGLASAVGAAVARPSRLTVACLGDGGALMAAGEFETIARLRLPMLVVVFNDRAYGAEVHHFGPGDHVLDTVRFPDTDFASFARGLGCEGITVRSTDDLAGLKKWLESRDRPLVVDAKVVPDVVAEWLEEAFRAH